MGWSLVLYVGSFDSFNVDIWRSFKPIFVALKEKFLFLVQCSLNLLSNIGVDIVDESLFVLVFLYFLFHIPLAVSYDLSVQVKLLPLLLNPLLLLSDLDRKEVHHRVVLLHLLQFLVKLVLEIPDLINFLLNFFKRLDRLYPVLITLRS